MGSWGSHPKKFRKTKLRLQLNNFTQKLNFDVLCLGEKSVQHLGRKKRKTKGKKSKKKLIATNNKLVGMKGYFITYNRVKYFFAVLKPFLNETAFYAKLSGWFLGPKTKVT